jgi:hypothetical protein
MSLELTLSLLHQREVFFRFENDEEGYYLSIIDRKKYPRVWFDNAKDGDVVIAETPENIINKVIPSEKDWEQRFFGKTIDECMDEFNKWDKAHRMPRLK